MRGVRLCPVALAGVLVALFAVPAFAQGDGRFSGSVFDQSGALIQGATVVVRNERTGEERSVVTSAQGRYIVTGLRPSTYTIRTSFGAFAPLEYTGMQLAAGQDFALDLTLLPAGVSEAVTVSGSTAIDLSSASMGVNVGEREVLNLPVNGRQMSQLMLQAPGSQNAGTGTWNDVRFSGRANQQNVIKYDGVEGSAIIDSAPGNIAGQIASPFRLQASLENVQEFRVESNNYPAEYGTGTGGQVNVVTKSGSNQFRGSVFEYFRNQGMAAPNYFDSTRNADGSVIQQLPQSDLRQHQFGASFGGPLRSDRAFFFFSYEGYRLDAGLNIIEAAPSAAAWATAVPAVAVLRPGFVGPSAVLLPGASTNPSFDVYQVQGAEEVREDAFSVRLDLRMSPQWSAYVRYFQDDGRQTRPESISGRVATLTNRPVNAIFNLQGVFGNGLLNEFKIGYNAPKAEVTGGAPTIGGVDFSPIAINMSGSVTTSGLQGSSTGVTIPGGLVRANSATNGRALIYDPYSLAFSNAVSSVRGSHLTKIGGEVRLINMIADQRYGTTYVYNDVTTFMANTPASIQYAGDISSPSVFNDGATGMRHMNQQYYVLFAQDQWHATPSLTLNYGLRYDYYTPLKVEDNLFVKFNLDTGQLDNPDSVNVHGTRKDNFQPRVSLTWAPGRTVFRTGFGIFVGPGQGEDLIQPIESDVVRTTVSSGPFLTAGYALDIPALVTNFSNNPNNRAYQPRAYSNEYEIPEKVYQYTASVQQELGGGFAATAAYVGSQGRNLFLRSVANQTVGLLQTSPTSSAANIREFDIVTCADGRVLDGQTTPLTASTICAGSTAISKQSPYAEIDFKTSGGHDSYNAMMLTLNRRSVNGLAMNLQYTLGQSRGTSGGSNEADTSANNARTAAQFDYDDGYNKYDVRHTFNVSVLYALPFGHGQRYGNGISPVANALLGGWEIGGIFNGRSGIPIPVQIVRPDVLYLDADGIYWANAQAGRTPVINTPGGGASRNVRRPDLVPGVNPYIEDGGLLYLNPAAFAAPMPGTFGNLERNSIVGPGFRQVDFFFSKHFRVAGRRGLEFRGEVFNVFDTVNFANPPGTLASAIPSGNAGTTPGANTRQPGQAYTPAAAGSWGRLNSTVGRTVGLGTSRQVQVALRYTF